MEAFGPPKPFPGAIVRHLDDIRTNNTLSNLAWGSFQDNTDDFKRNNPETYADGKLFPRQKLTLAQVTQIRELLKAKVPLKRLGRMFGVDRTSIRDIRDGRSYRNT